ncbi:hypothetical protein MST27_14390 [Pseudomonas sp. PS1]|uniref:Uncharacterized protein n=1 Tax=Stutzerimonas marianensis TaxID=2929513 RepID=A0A9X2AVF8_9GAMM|nr:hypothetical protein [Pseudomonas marianensis]MCJ0974557.1 hypothetical protein [Pseudomonas marianensis]
MIHALVTALERKGAHEARYQMTQARRMTWIKVGIDITRSGENRGVTKHSQQSGGR